MPVARIPRPSPAMVVALLALIVALSGNAIAGTAHSAKHTTKVRLAARDSVGSAAVIDNSLLLKDFRSSERAKLAGAAGPAGPPGPPGPAGTVDASSFYDRATSDTRFLGATAPAVDAARLGGVPASGYTTGNGSQDSRYELLSNAVSDDTFLDVGSLVDLTAFCQAGVASLGFEKRTADTVTYTGSVVAQPNSSSSAATDELLAGTANRGSTLQVFGVKAQLTLQLHRVPQTPGGPTDDATVLMTAGKSVSGDPVGSCRFAASYVLTHHP